MGRDHARIHLDIWGDDDFLDLPVDAQMLYFTLWTSDGRTLCGAHDWNPKRLTQRAADWTIERIEAAAEILSERLFLIIDTETDECLLRSWIKHDGLWRTPNMAVSVSNARANVASRNLRGIIVFEVLKLRLAEPTSTSWAKPAVQSMLSQTPVDPADVEPFKGARNGASKGGAKGASNPCPNGGANQNPTHGVNGASNGGPTNAIPITIAIKEPPYPHETDVPPRRTGAEIARTRFANIPARSAVANEIAQQFAKAIGLPAQSNSITEIGGEVEKCIREGFTPPHIAEGMRDWAKSDSWSPTQIPRFVIKAAARHAVNVGDGKPTRKGQDYDTAAQELLDELDTIA